MSDDEGADSGMRRTAGASSVRANPLTLGLTLLLAAPAAGASPTPTADVAPATPDGTKTACVGGDRQPGNGGVDVAVNAAGDAVVTWTPGEVP